MQHNLKRDYLWNTAGVFAQSVLSPLLLVVITRINGIHESGIFSFAFSVAIILWAISMWGGRTYQVSDTKHEFSQRDYIAVRMFLAFAVLVCAVVFCLLNHYSAMKSAVIIALVVYKIVESIADVLYGVLQVHDKLFIVGKSLIYKAIFAFAGFTIIDIMTRSLLFSSFALIFMNICFVIFYDIRIVKKLEEITLSSIQSETYFVNTFNIMRRCLTIFATTLLVMLSLNIPRYFIDQYHSEQIGYFGILAMPVTLIALIMTFLLQPNVLNLSMLYKRKKYNHFTRVVQRILFMTLAVGITILAIAFMAGVQLLELVFGVEFHRYKQALLIMLVGAIANALVAILMNVLTIMRHFRLQFYILFATDILLTIFSAEIVKTSGLIAGVCLFALTSISQLFLLILSYNLTMKNYAHAEED